jgi:hypothetical protein
VHSHCGGNTCLGADGCDIGRGPERAHAAAERVHAATGAGGIKKPSHYFFFANLSSRSAPCPSTPSTLCKELWYGRLVLKLVGGGALSFFIC